jgi:hypothetical protein
MKLNRKDFTRVCHVSAVAGLMPVEAVGRIFGGEDGGAVPFQLAWAQNGLDSWKQTGRSV